jgi:hypothetical protein
MVWTGRHVLFVYIVSEMAGGHKPVRLYTLQELQENALLKVSPRDARQGEICDVTSRGSLCKACRGVSCGSEHLLGDGNGYSRAIC